VRDINRLRTEISLLERNYGAGNVQWPQDFGWIYVNRFLLPPGKYNQSACKALVLVPEHYGYGVPYTDFFVSQGILVQHGGNWHSLPHYFDRFPYRHLKDNFVSELQSQGWSYLCLHPERWRQSDSILTFLVQAYTFLSDPFRDWDNKR